MAVVVGEGKREVGKRPRWTKAIVPVRTSMGWFGELPRNRTCQEIKRKGVEGDGVRKSARASNSRQKR